MDGILIGLASAILSGLVVAYYKKILESRSRIETEARDNKDEALANRFALVENRIETLRLLLESVSSEVKEIKSSDLSMAIQVTEVLGHVTYVRERMDRIEKDTDELKKRVSPSDYGKVVRRN